jgi:thiol-disulfide isomerase/thioredoxin
MLQLTTPEQFKRLLDGGSRFIVWYSAAWCGPCQRMEKPRLEEATRIPIYYCDEVVNPDVSVKEGVRQFPTFVFYSAGKEQSRRAHYDTTKICQWIVKFCK